MNNILNIHCQVVQRLMIHQQPKMFHMSNILQHFVQYILHHLNLMQLLHLFTINKLEILPKRIVGKPESLIILTHSLFERNF